MPNTMSSVLPRLNSTARQFQATVSQVQKLLGRMAQLMHEAQAGSHLSKVRKLTVREKEVFLLTQQKKSRSFIANKLGISPKTVSTLKRSAADKLGLKSARDLKHTKKK